MLNSAQHAILTAHKYKNIKKFSIFSGSDKPSMLFFLFINVKMPSIVGKFNMNEQEKIMLSCVEHEILFITSRPGLDAMFLFRSPLHECVTFRHESIINKKIIDLCTSFSRSHDYIQMYVLNKALAKIV